MSYRPKRLSDEDETHNRPPKPPDRTDPPDKSSENHPNSLESKNQFRAFEKYQIYPRHLVISSTDESNDITDLSCFKIAKELTQILRLPVENIKREIKSKTIQININNRADSDKLLNLEKLCNIPVKVTPHKTLNIWKGVIKSVELKGLEKEEIIQELKEDGVIDAANITIKKNNKIIKTNTWILTFERSTPIQEIKIPNYMTLKVYPYIPKPMICRNCKKLGHTEKNCKFPKQSRCPTCGQEQHTKINTPVERNSKEEQTSETDEEIVRCPYDKTGWCQNCREAGHWSHDRNCIKYKQIQEILKHKANYGGTFFDAKKYITNKNKVLENSYANVAKGNNLKAQGPQISYKKDTSKIDKPKESMPTNSPQKNHAQNTQTKNPSINKSQLKSQKEQENCPKQYEEKKYHYKIALKH